MTAAVVTAIEPKIRLAEIERAQRKPTENLRAYDLALRALPHMHSLSSKGLAEASRLFRQAIEIDPTYALAFAQLAFCLYMPVNQGWLSALETDLAEIVRLARTAVERGGDDPEVLAWAAFIIGSPGRDLRGAIALVEKALALNLNSNIALIMSAYLHVHNGDTRMAIEHAEQAERLNPLEGNVYRQNIISMAHFLAGQYEDAAEFAERALTERPDAVFPMRRLAASLGLLGRIDEAHKVVQRLRILAPELTVSRARGIVEIDSDTRSKMYQMLDAYCEGLRRAGLPE